MTESNGIQSAIQTLEKKGFNLDHYAAQENPLFELVERSVPAAAEPVEGEALPAVASAKATPADSKKANAKKPKAKVEERRSDIHSIPQILEQIKEIGKRAFRFNATKAWVK